MITDKVQPSGPQALEFGRSAKMLTRTLEDLTWSCQLYILPSTATQEINCSRPSHVVS